MQIPSLLFAVFLCAVGLLGCTRAQTCEPWPGIPSGCAPFLNISAGDLVFVPAGNDVLATGHRIARLISLLLFSLKEPARTTTINTICLSNFRPCSSLSSNETALPVNPCQQLCQNYMDDAYSAMRIVVTNIPVTTLGVYVPPNNTRFLYCNETDVSYDYQPFWPVASNTITIDNETLTVPCMPQIHAELDFYCYAPLGRDGVRCSFVCPAPSFTDSQYDAAKVMQNVVAWISWAGSSVLITSLALYPPTRKFPKILILFLAIAANIAAGAMLLPTFAGYQETWCGGDDSYMVPSYRTARYYSQGVLRSRPTVVFEYDTLLTHSSLCTFQGAMLQFGYLASTFWWAMIAVNMLLELFLSSIIHTHERVWTFCRMITYNIIGWCLPFLLMVIPASAEKIGFGPGDTYCFVTYEDDHAWILVFFFIPVGISLLIGLSCFLVAIVKILITSIKLRKPWLILQYFRLLLFIFIFLFIYTFIFSYVITIAANEDTITEGYSNYFLCLLDPWQPPNTGTCTLSEDVSNYNLTMLKGFSICCLGFLLFLTFMSWEVLKNWWLLAKAIYACILRRELQPLRRALTSTTKALSTGLSMTQADATKSLTAEEKAEEEEREDEESSSSDSSATSAQSDLANSNILNSSEEEN